VVSCSKKKTQNAVVFDTEFHGARLDSVEYLGKNKYRAHIFPENEPINKSPWFAFGMSAEDSTKIILELTYGEYKHRYIPKLSNDKKSWKKISPRNIKVDTISGIATLQLNVSKQKLYIAAQEIESSKDTYLWINSLLKKHSEFKKIVAGKTVLKNNNYCVEFENKGVKNAIVLIARQHPPEIPGGTIGFKAFFETLLEDTQTGRSFREKFNIYTFPLLNPDGADLGYWRHNANGKDLNRDWIDFSQPETKMVKDYLDTKIQKGKIIRFALDFHTSFSGPYLLVLDSINEIKTKKIIPNWIKNIEENSTFKVNTRRRSQELPYCYNWFYNAFDTEAVTYEDGDEIERDLIRKKAKVYATELMKTLIDKSNKNEFEN
jgi:hypothetical protein